MDSDLEVAQARLGKRVGGRWLLERVLGTGGMGAVYAARSPEGHVAAVKILHPEMGARREVRERFLREGTAANTIGHPGVVRMLGEGDGEEAFLAMELLEGETLRERVRRHGRLPLEEVLSFAEQVLDVLVVAHARGVIHRDLKPDNLFVTLDGRIKVLDFGLARLLEGVPGRQQTRTGVALGTLAYMAPEQALGRRGEIDGRVDVFALGATMFRVLSGRGVHEADSEAELLMAMASRPAPPLASLVPGTPAGIAAVVDLALAFSRDAR
ncbi:MAG TPA: serine/threonine-protein kinase, partial [Polyangiaceae bacterium]|nr:serine/threonine-protein kinase [Polyangiaceae bacterium]